MKISSICRRKRVILFVLLVTLVTVTMIKVFQPNYGPSIRSQPSKIVYNDFTRSSPHVSLQKEKDFSKSVSSLPTKRSTTEPTREGTIVPLYGNVTKECFPLEDPSAIKTPFNFFIYDLPPKYNTDIRKKMSTIQYYAYCYNLNYCGAGEELYQYTNAKGEQLYRNQAREQDPMSLNYLVSVRNTHQFALEAIIHHKLMHSPYRTLDPAKANMFYIPAYTGLTCLSESNGGNSFVQDLFTYLKTTLPQYFLSGRPHFSTLSKIQREQGSQSCGTLRHPDSANITYIAIEKESNPYWALRGPIYGKSIIVAPYPSYIHFIPTIRNPDMKEFNPNISDLINNTKFQLMVPSLAERNIKLFLASSTRRSNHFRAKIIDQFKNQTKYSYEQFCQEYTSNHGADRPKQILDVMLKTPECSSGHRTTTIPWMRHSVFCLQPPGDSPTRKSFYDSILSGCIPVIFSHMYKTEYPFQKVLDYSKFTFTIDEKLISMYDKKVLDIIEGIQQGKIESMHKNLLKVAKWFQYSMNDGSIQQDTDAVTLILQQLQELYKL